ncbi:MAG: methyltransferase domain-containing protein [Solirubrobacterales bacterium]
MTSLRRAVGRHLPERLRGAGPFGPRYELATRYLGGLRGIEIGGAAHNRYPVEAINVDRAPVPDAAYREAQMELAGEVATVDLVAEGDRLPLPDKSTDFVLASHVIEHFPDPVGALLEWERVATRYLFIVVPHHERTFDSGRPLTSANELMRRHEEGFASDEDRHWSVWDCAGFVDLCRRLGLEVVATEDPDRKVGNGFAVVIAVDPDRPIGSAQPS